MKADLTFFCQSVLFHMIINDDDNNEHSAVSSLVKEYIKLHDYRSLLITLTTLLYLNKIISSFGQLLILT